MNTQQLQDNSDLLNGLAFDLLGTNNRNANITQPPIQQSSPIPQQIPQQQSSPLQTADLQNSLDQLMNGSDITASVLQLAQNIDISWIEMSARICIAAIIILIFKEIIFSIYRYICIRMDKYIGIGTIIKFQNQTYGRIENYDIRTISIRTKDGLVKIPLEVWLNSYYTQISKHAIDITTTTDIDDVRKMLQMTNQDQDTKLNYLYNELKNLKQQSGNKNVYIPPNFNSTDVEIKYDVSSVNKRPDLSSD